MGTNTLSEAIDGTTISTEDPNQFKTALQGDIVPRNSSGVATTAAGSIGQSALRWLASYVNTHWIGDTALNNKIANAAAVLAITSDDSIALQVGGVTKALIETTGMDAVYLKAASILTAQIGDNEVTGAKIANLAILTAHIIALQVTNAKLTADAVTSSKILDNELSDELMAALTDDISSAINFDTTYTSGQFGTLFSVGATSEIGYTTGGVTSIRPVHITLQPRYEPGGAALGTTSFFGLEAVGTVGAPPHIEADLCIRKKSTTFSSSAYKVIYRNKFSFQRANTPNDLYIAEWPLGLTFIDDNTDVGTGEAVKYELAVIPITSSGLSGLRVRITNGEFRLHLIR